MGETLAPDLRLVGPLYEFESAAQYLASLHANPLETCTYELIQIAETGDNVLVFYNYRKAEESIVIGQLFGFQEGKISEILLVFDSQRVT